MMQLGFRLGFQVDWSHIKRSHAAFVSISPMLANISDVGYKVLHWCTSHRLETCLCIQIRTQTMWDFILEWRILILECLQMKMTLKLSILNLWISWLESQDIVACEAPEGLNTKPVFTSSYLLGGCSALHCNWNKPAHPDICWMEVCASHWSLDCLLVAFVFLSEIILTMNFASLGSTVHVDYNIDNC